MRIQTTPDAILTEIHQELLDQDVFEEGTLLMRTNADQILLSPPRSTVYGVIVPGGMSVDQSQVAGGGRANTSVEWTVSVWVVQQLMLDQGDADDEFLTHSTLGVMQKIDEVMEALHLYDIPDTLNPTSDLLLNEPMRALDINQGRKDASRYGSFEIPFEVKFKWALS